jgi:hypothetical protein
MGNEKIQIFFSKSRNYFCQGSPQSIDFKCWDVTVERESLLYPFNDQRSQAVGLEQKRIRN